MIDIERTSFKVNKFIKDIREYKLVPQEIWTMNKQHRLTSLKLDWNESTIGPSPKVADRMKELLNEGIYNIYPNTNNKTLVESIAAYSNLPCEYIQYFASSDSLHEYICRLYLNQYSRVLILSPSYDNFRLTAESFGAEIIYSDLSTDFRFNRELFEQDIKNYKPSLVYICNPNNPTGTQHNIEYIEYLLINFDKTLFLIDEAYWEFSGITAKNLVKKYRNILISRTFSKAFGLANFRIGYMLASPFHIEMINKIRNPKNITTFSQEAAIAALSDLEYMKEYVNIVNDAKEYFYQELSNCYVFGKAIKGEGNFLLFLCKNENIKQKIIDYLKNNNIFVRSIAQRPSTLNCIRFSIGTREQMSKVLNVLTKMKKEFL